MGAPLLLCTLQLIPLSTTNMSAYAEQCKSLLVRTTLACFSCSLWRSYHMKPAAVQKAGSCASQKQWRASAKSMVMQVCEPHADCSCCNVSWPVSLHVTSRQACRGCCSAGTDHGKQQSGQERPPGYHCSLQWLDSCLGQRRPPARTHCKAAMLMMFRHRCSVWHQSAFWAEM